MAMLKGKVKIEIFKEKMTTICKNVANKSCLVCFSEEKIHASVWTDPLVWSQVHRSGTLVLEWRCYMGGGLLWPGSSFDVIVVLADLAEIWRRDIFFPFWKVGNIKIIDFAHLVQNWAILAKFLFSKIEASFLLKMDLVESHWSILGEKIRKGAFGQKIDPKFCMWFEMTL